MAVYADYTFYTEQFGGTAIAQLDFNRLARQASARIDELTFERAAAIISADSDENLIERIQLATCALAEELQAQQNGGVISSERVGSYAVTYAVSAAMSNQVRLSATARVYLGSSGLMYRGFEDESTTAMVTEAVPEEPEEPGDGIPT